ncbi:50S ribosomal protein L23 [Candidatus Wolfebacteria bacterium]|nr:50S ribosomal protein L23 [Candidatus Wolfebacteria bacterium]
MGSGPILTSNDRRFDILKQVWITEKSADLSKRNKYVFAVDKKSNKSEIKKAVETAYGVGVRDVNILNTASKVKRLGKTGGRVLGFKKAVVSLKPGHKLDVMPT